MIKIVHLRWGEPIGGVERVLRDLASYHDRKSFDIHFIFLARGGPYAEVMRTQGFPVHIIPANSGFDPLMRLHLLHLLRYLQPDLVHEHGIPPLVRPLIKWAVPAGLLTFEHGEIAINWQKGKPWLNSLHGFELRHFSALTVVNSSANRNLILQTHRLRPNQTQVVHLGIDLQQFPFASTTSTPVTELTIGFVGRIQFYDKGADELIPLAHSLRQHGLANFQIRIVGDGPDRQALEARIRAEKLAAHFVVLGQRDDVAAELSICDIIVLPSRMEAFGLVALEALAVGTRVVAYALPGPREVLTGCADAVLIPPGELESMADAIVRLWRTQGKQRTTLGRSYVEEHFSALVMVRRLEQIYRSLLCA